MKIIFIVYSYKVFLQLIKIDTFNITMMLNAYFQKMDLFGPHFMKFGYNFVPLRSETQINTHLAF